MKTIAVIVALVMMSVSVSVSAESVRCSACKKQLMSYSFNGKKTPITAVSFQIDASTLNPQRVGLKKNLGSYFKGWKVHEYNVCYECLLKSLGVKP